LDISFAFPYAYVAAGRTGLQTLDISNPSSPHHIGGTDPYKDFLGVDATNVCAIDDRVYVNDNFSGLQIFDVSNPAAPIQISTLGNVDSSSYISANGNYLYLVEKNIGLKTFDISSGPGTHVGTLSEIKRCNEMIMHDNLAYAAGSYFGLYVIDVSEPSTPALINVDSSFKAIDLAIKNNLLYVAASNNGFIILSLTNPSQPTLIGQYKTGYGMDFVALCDEFLFASPGWNKILIYEISNPASPQLIDSLETGALIKDLAVVDNHLYVTGTNGILSFFIDLQTGIEDNLESQPEIYTAALSHNYPNPFNPSTTIEYSLLRQSNIELTIFDLLGRKVKTLIKSNKPAGSYSVTWDGRDESGQPVATGVYLYRLTAGDFTQTKKMLVLK
jgi:hypothetical protein